MDYVDKWGWGVEGIEDSLWAGEIKLIYMFYR